MENCDTLMISKRFKEKIKEIPDDINDETHITQYIKNIIKEISEEKKLKDFKKRRCTDRQNIKNLLKIIRYASGTKILRYQKQSVCHCSLKNGNLIK
jgi:hypothetical protein